MAAAKNDAKELTCTNNSDYAVICSFFEQFGDKSGLLFPSFNDLQQMLENVEEVSYPLIELHVKLMRKLKKSVNFDRWEKAAAKYAHSYSDQDGWEIERFGYKKLNLAVKLRLLKNLLEAQFDGNIKFKNEISKVTSDELRLQPLGKDIQGRRYWHQLDDDCNLRVYREDLDDETWDLVSSDKESMLKLIEQLSSDNGLQEDEGTSPATSEENSANGQEEDVKGESEDRMQQLTDEHSETKRLKIEPVKDPVVSESQEESIVSDAIESPVLLVKGEGNGADCDTGNPGEDGKDEESCESHNLNSEQDKLNDPSAIDCESNKLKSCTESSETMTISQPNPELPDSVPDSACQSLTLSSIPDNSNEIAPEDMNKMSGDASNNVKQQPDSEDCPVNLEENNLDLLTSKRKSKLENSQINAANSKIETDNLDEESKSMAPENITSNSIEQPSSDVDSFPNKKECTKPSEDVVDKSSKVDVSKPFECAVSKTTVQNSTLTHNQELPKIDCFSVDVKLSPIQLKSAIAEESVKFPNDAVSSDQHPSASYDNNEETVLPPVCSPSIPAELEETKQNVELVSMPDHSTLLQENSSKIEESHSDQTKELNEKCLDDVNYKVEQKVNTVEVNAERTNQTPHESPAKIEIKDKEVFSEMDDSNSHNQRIEPNIDSASQFSNVDDLLNDSQDSDIATLSTLSSSLPTASEQTHVVSIKDFDPPSTLQRKTQSSEDDPAIKDTKKRVNKKEGIGATIPQTATESEVIEESPIPTTNYLQLPQIKETTSASQGVAITTNHTIVSHVEKELEVPACTDDPINKSVTKELPVCSITDYLLQKTNNASNSCEAQNSILGNLDEENKKITPDVNLPKEENISTTIEKKFSVQDEVVSNCIQEIPDKEELSKIKDSTSSVHQPASNAVIIAEHQSLPEIPMENVMNTSEDLVTKLCKKEDSSETSKVHAKEIYFVKEGLLSARQEPILEAIQVVSQDTLKAINSDGFSELEAKEESLAIQVKDEIQFSKHPKLETNMVSQKIEVNETTLGEVLAEHSESENEIPPTVPGISVQQEPVNDPNIIFLQKQETNLKDERVSEDLKNNFNVAAELIEKEVIPSSVKEVISQQEPESKLVLCETELERIEPKAVLPYQVLETEVIPTTKNETSSEATECNKEKSTLTEESKEISLKDDCRTPEIATNPKMEESDQSTNQPKIFGIDAKEELLPVVQEQMEQVTIPISLPKENVEDRTVADKSMESPKEEVIPENEMLPKLHDKILSEKMSNVISKIGPSLETLDVEESILAEEKKENSAFSSKDDECCPPEVPTIPKLEDNDQTTIQPKIVVDVDAKEELIPMAHEHIKQFPVQENLNYKLPISLPAENVQDRGVTKESIKSPKEKVIPTTSEKEMLPKEQDKLLSEKKIDVLSKIEPNSEEPCSEESILTEEKNKISAFTQKDECHFAEVPTNPKIEEIDQTTIQPKIVGKDAKEELIPLVDEQMEQVTIPISLPKENVQDRVVADESKENAEPLITDVREDIVEAKFAMHLENDQEMKPVSQVPNSVEIQQGFEAKPLPNGPDTEKSSSNFNQLTFDFDASAPVAIIFPPSKNQDTSAKGRGRKRGRCGFRGNDDSGKENDAQPTVLRQSSRIAKLREKEDEDRRNEEAARLKRLKEEHERREKRRTERDERMKKMEEKQQRRQLKSTKREDVTYKESEDESSSSDEEKNSEEEGRKKKGKKDKRKKVKKIDRPWDSTDSSEKSSESDLDALEDLQVEPENEELDFKSDHEFSPESDLDEEVETVQPTKHARTAKAGTVRKKRGRSKKVKVEEEEVIEEEEVAVTEEEEEVEAANCHKCGQSDHPEWILLCDRCDAGWHANCVKPPLLVIPEGNWFCPPCDHATLLERLQERLEAYEFLLQEKEAELERKKEQELEAKVAKEEAEKQALLDMEEEAQDDDDEDEKNSGVGNLGGDGEDAEDEETSDESGEDEEEEDEESQNESDENLNGRRQRKAAKQANYSFKDFDDMIKSALRDEGDEEEEEGGKGKGKGKGLRSGVEDNSDEDKPRSPPGSRPSGIGNKRISTSDDDSDIMPQVSKKKKARKLNDLSATSNEDDSDEDFQGSSAEGSDSEDDEEDASDSGDSFVVDDDSDDDDVIHVRAKKKARAASPIIRRSARSARKRNLRMDSSDTSEEESEYEEKPAKRKRGNESWDSSGESSSDASWGRSKKRSKAKPVAVAPKPKPKPPPRKTPVNRGRGRGGRSNKVESDDEPFRSNVSVKKIKEARPVKAQEDEDSDHAQRRTTRGRQISYKELISSGESQDEDGSTVKKMGTLFSADRNKSMAGAVIRGGASRRGGVGRGGVISSGRGNISGSDNTPVPVSVISSRAILKQDDDSRFSGSTDTIEFSAAAAAASVYTTGDESHTSNDILTPSIDPDLANLPIILPEDDVASPTIKDELPATTSVLSQDLQVSRLIQQMPADVAPTSLPPDLQINRLINSQTISSSSNSPARQSPGILPQPRLVRDVLDSQTPPPPAVQLPPIMIPIQPQIIAPSVDLPLYSHGGVIKQTRHSLPPTPPMYSSPHVVKTSDLIVSSAPPSVIRPYPTTATPSSLSPSISGSSTPGNPLSIQGLLGTGHGSVGSVPPHPSGHIRPYGNTPHMIGHGPFLNHSPYANPYSAVPASRTSSIPYMGTPVTPTPRQAYPPMYSSPHLPPLHSPYQHHGPPLRPTSSYQHAGFPQAFAAAAAAAASAVEEERRIYRVAAQASRESGADNFDPSASIGLLPKSGADDLIPVTSVPPESEFGGLVSYFSSQQEDFEES